MLGITTSQQLGRLLDGIQNLSNALIKISAEEFETSVPEIIQTAKVLSDVAGTVKAQLSTKCLSKNTYTK